MGPLALAETLAFVAPLVRGRRRVLEVGCGRGELAAALAAAGHEVVGSDVALPEHLPAGPRLSFVAGDFRALDAGTFDAVVFVTSLHHIAPIDGAVDHAARCLVPGGVLVAEEFALEAVDAPTARWYYDTAELLAAAGRLPPGHIHGAPSDEPVARWLAEHAHDEPLTEGGAMRRAIDARLAPVEATTGPFLYRSLVDRVEHGSRPGDPAVARIGRHLLDTELRKIAEGSLAAVGLRMVARAG